MGGGEMEEKRWEEEREMARGGIGECAIGEMRMAIMGSHGREILEMDGGHR